MTNHPEETYDALVKSDAQLAALAPSLQKYRHHPSEQVVLNTKKALEEKKVACHVFKTGNEALNWLKQNIPKGKTIFNPHSTSLEEIGFVEYLKQQKEWVNLHEKVFAEKDPAKQNALYKEGLNADYVICSATAVSQQGDITAADLTGTKTGAFTYGAGTLVLVVGTHKIVENYEACVKRTEELAFAVESARVRLAYKIPVAIRGPNPFSSSPRVIVLFVKETLGY